MLRTRLKTANL